VYTAPGHPAPQTKKAQSRRATSTHPSSTHHHHSPIVADQPDAPSAQNLEAHTYTCTPSTISTTISISLERWSIARLCAFATTACCRIRYRQDYCGATRGVCSRAPNEAAAFHRLSPVIPSARETLVDSQSGAPQACRSPW
jgi:hypothetical protein